MDVATDHQHPRARSKTVGEAIRRATRILVAMDIETARLDAQVLLAHTLDITRERVFGYPERVLTDAERGHFADLIARRSARQPLSQIVGRREFWGRDCTVKGDTLTPRPDSETVIAAVLDRLPPPAGARPVRILDLGTGTGCLVLTLLAELPKARGLGVDISAAALDVARGNGRRLGVGDRVRFVLGDWCAALPHTARFDVVVANPPYIANRDFAGLAPEVSAHEPAPALRGGPDGLAAYRRFAPQLARVLARHGFAVIEVGAGQAQGVARILSEGGLKIRGIERDLAGLERCIVADGR